MPNFKKKFLGEYEKHEILRMEVRISNIIKLQQVIKKEMGGEMNKDMTEAVEIGIIKFCYVFNENLAKRILRNYLKEIKTMLYTVMASYKDGMLQYFISEGIKPRMILLTQKHWNL